MINVELRRKKKSVALVDKCTSEINFYRKIINLHVHPTVEALSR